MDHKSPAAGSLGSSCFLIIYPRNRLGRKVVEAHGEPLRYVSSTEIKYSVHLISMQVPWCWACKLDNAAVTSCTKKGPECGLTPGDTLAMPLPPTESCRYTELACPDGLLSHLLSVSSRPSFLVYTAPVCLGLLTTTFLQPSHSFTNCHFID